MISNNLSNKPTGKERPLGWEGNIGMNLKETDVNTLLESANECGIEPAGSINHGVSRLSRLLIQTLSEVVLAAFQGSDIIICICESKLLLMPHENCSIHFLHIPLVRSRFSISFISLF